jgi:hypothetical protein
MSYFKTSCSPLWSYSTLRDCLCAESASWLNHLAGKYCNTSWPRWPLEFIASGNKIDNHDIPIRHSSSTSFLDQNITDGHVICSLATYGCRLFLIRKQETLSFQAQRLIAARILMINTKKLVEINEHEKGLHCSRLWGSASEIRTILYEKLVLKALPHVDVPQGNRRRRHNLPQQMIPIRKRVMLTSI